MIHCKIVQFGHQSVLYFLVLFPQATRALAPGSQQIPLLEHVLTPGPVRRTVCVPSLNEAIVRTLPILQTKTLRLEEVQFAHSYKTIEFVF